MIRTTCTQSGELLRPLRTREHQGVIVVAIMRDHPAIRGHRGTKGRQNPRRNVSALLQRRVLQSSEYRAFLGLMREDEFAHLVYRAETAPVALALRVSPGEQTVARKDEPVAAGIVANGLLQL